MDQTFSQRKKNTTIYWTSNKLAAQELHDRFKSDLWRQNKLKEKPDRLWQEAVVKWLDEVKEKRKRSMENAKIQLKWLNPYLKHKKLSEIDRNLLDGIAKKKEEEKVAPATVNRMLEVVRAILNKAVTLGMD